jgi:hypothetical protein
MLAGGITALLGLAFKNKAMINIGLSIAGVGGAAKGISRIR